MKKLRSLLKRTTASILTLLTVFSTFTALQVAPVYAANPQGTVKIVELNPFDNLHCNKQAGGQDAHDATIMGVTIDGVEYIAYCLNPRRYGSNHNFNSPGTALQPGQGSYSVEVYDLDDPNLPMDTFSQDATLMYKLQGIITSGGYAGGDDSTVKTLMDPYNGTRQLYFTHQQAYAVTKYALWSLSEGWTPQANWSVSPGTYSPHFNNASEEANYMYQSLVSLYGAGTNWTHKNDNSIYPIIIDSNGQMWKQDSNGLEYMEFKITTGLLGDSIGNDKNRRARMEAAIEVEPLPDGIPEHFYLADDTGKKIEGKTTLDGYQNLAWESARTFRLYAEKGADKSLLDPKKPIASAKTRILTYDIKYGKAIPPSGKSVQNYALVPKDGWRDVSTLVKVQGSTATDPDTLSFQIKKVDGATGLAGAEFHVTGPDGFDKTYTTPTSGILNISVNAAGTYIVKETKAPVGYSIDPTEHKVEVEDGGEQAVLTIENGQESAIKIIKKAANTGERLAGAVFSVTNMDTGYYTEVETGDTGEVTVTGLIAGSYVVEEKTPPPGYLPAKNPTQKTQLQSNSVAEFVYVNEPETGKVKIKKTAKNNGDPLEGVTFNIRRRDGAEQWDVTTDANGEAEIELPVDWYVITETDAPDNVEINSEPHEVEIKPGETYELALTNVLKKTLIIEKRDTKTNELVPGMIFEIKSPEGDLFGAGNCGRGEGIYKVGEDGTLTFDNMETGTSWVITEVEAPPGYVLNPEPQTKLSDGETPLEFTFYNK